MFSLISLDSYILSNPTGHFLKKKTTTLSPSWTEKAHLFRQDEFVDDL